MIDIDSQGADDLTLFHSKILRDNIEGVTKGDIRRLARRGGVKRISVGVYPEVRLTLRRHLEKVSKHTLRHVQVD